MINLLINILFIFSTFLNTGASQCLDAKIAVTHMVSDGLKRPSDLNARTFTTQLVTTGDNGFLGKDSTVGTSLLLLLPPLSTERTDTCSPKNQRGIGFLASLPEDILLTQQWYTQSKKLDATEEEFNSNRRSRRCILSVVTRRLLLLRLSLDSNEYQVYYSLFHFTVLRSTHARTRQTYRSFSVLPWSRPHPLHDDGARTNRNCSSRADWSYCTADHASQRRLVQHDGMYGRYVYILLKCCV